MSNEVDSPVEESSDRIEKQEYYLPEYGVTIEALNLEDAYKEAEKLKAKQKKESK